MTGAPYMTKKIFFALGTVCTLTLYGGDVNAALNRSKERIMQIHHRMNAYDEKSEISRINAAAGEGYVPVSEDTFRLIEASVDYSRMTNGLYDITTRPLSALWKSAIASKSLPIPYEIDCAAKLTGYRDILLDRRNLSVMLRRRGQQLDLGAIAKGYAADEVRRILKEEKIAEAIINLGGTVVSIGKSRRIGIQNPFEKTGTVFAYIDAADQAVVTSGLYEQGFTVNDRCYHHIIDPHTGYPSSSELAGVTLIGSCAEELDALSTTALMLGVEKSIPLLQSRGIEAIFVTKDGEIYTTNGLNRRCAKAS